MANRLTRNTVARSRSQPSALADAAPRRSLVRAHEEAQALTATLHHDRGGRAAHGLARAAGIRKCGRTMQKYAVSEV